MQSENLGLRPDTSNLVRNSSKPNYQSSDLTPDFKVRIITRSIFGCAVTWVKFYIVLAYESFRKSFKH